jgi:hypothetical protein
MKSKYDINNVVILPIPSKMTHIHYSDHVHILMFPVTQDEQWTIPLHRN